MTNKTLIPAFAAKVGDWDYYMCMMKYGSVAREFQFAHELGQNADLGTMLQRGLSDRSRDIVEYLTNSKHRFLGAMIIAAHGGSPQFTPVDLGLVPELAGCDREFGFLSFDGSQLYFALDGQHRLAAIKQSVLGDPSLAKEDICVLIVPHFDTEKGRERTRRLFTNINRNAKATSKAENIALDEDDAFAILARRLVNDHKFLKVKGVVKIFTRQHEGGDLKLAGKSVGNTEKDAFTTLATLYDVIRSLGFDLDQAFHLGSQRPTDSELESAYRIISGRLDLLLTHCGEVRNKMEQSGAHAVRVSPSGKEKGHAFMRPAVQLAVAEALRELVQTERGVYEDLVAQLSGLSWEIGLCPWRSVFNVKNGTMINAKENQDLLISLIKVHLAPQSRLEISRARTQFKNLTNERYSFSEDELANKIREQ